MKVAGKGSIQALEDRPRKHCRKWRLFVRADGKQRTRVVHGTYSHAEMELDAFKRELEERIETDMVLGTLADSVLEYRRASGMYAIGTLMNFERDVRTIKRVLGDARLDSITPSVVRDSLSSIRNGNNATGRVLSGTYMIDIYGTLKGILDVAVSDGLIASNPVDKVQAPRVDTLEKDWMPEDRFMDFIGNVSREPLDGRVMSVLFMAQLGLRRGEACALYDSDVHDGVAHIRRAIKERNGTIGVPKSRSGIRNLPMPQLLSEKVSEWRDIRSHEPRYRSAITLCCDSRGGVLRPQNLYKWWERNKARLGADGFTLHQIRHSNLSLMARHMSPFDLKDWAGWSSLAPARVYIHQDSSALRAAVDDAWGC